MKWPWNKKLKKYKDPKLNYQLGELLDKIKAVLDCEAKLRSAEYFYTVELCRDIPYQYEFIIHRGDIIASISIADTLLWLTNGSYLFYQHIVYLVDCGERKRK